MKYCEFCGKPIEGKGPCSCPEAQARAQAKPKKKILIFGIIAVAVIAAIIIAIFALSSNSEDSPSPFKKSSKIDPFDYLEITFEGYDGIGTAYIIFDDYAIDEEIFGPEPEDMQEYFEWEARYEDFEGSIEYECSKEEGLSNGDKITITFTVTDDYRKHVQEKSKEITVKGLTETTKFDFFSNIEVIFDGISGDAKDDVNTLLESDMMDICNFSCYPSWDLGSGDTVTVTIENVDTLAEMYQIIPLELSKEYIVPVLPEYVSSVEQIPVEIVKEFANKFVEEEQEYLDTEFSFFTFSDVKYYGSYLFIGESSSFSIMENKLLIFIYYDEFYEGEFRETVYIPLMFNNIAIGSDGSLDIEYEDGYTSIATSNINNYLEEQDEDYEIHELAID